MTTEQEQRIQARNYALSDCRYRYYEFEPNSFEGRYYNANGFGCAIVVCIGIADDWSAYIGGCNPEVEEDGLKFVASHGCKLSEEDARYFFPFIELRYRS